MARFVFVLNGSLSMIGAGAMFLHPEKFQMGDALSSGARMFSLKYSLLLASFGFFSIFMHTQPDTPTKRLVAASFMLYNVLSVVVMFMGMYVRVRVRVCTCVRVCVYIIFFYVWAQMHADDV